MSSTIHNKENSTPIVNQSNTRGTDSNRKAWLVSKEVHVDMLDCVGEARIAMIDHSSERVSERALRKFFSPVRAPGNKSVASRFATSTRTIASTRASNIETSSVNETMTSCSDSNSKTSRDSSSKSDTRINGKRSRDDYPPSVPTSASTSISAGAINLQKKRRKRLEKNRAEKLVAEIAQVKVQDEYRVFDRCPELVRKVRIHHAWSKGRPALLFQSSMFSSLTISSPNLQCISSLLPCLRLPSSCKIRQFVKRDGVSQTLLVQALGIHGHSLNSFLLGHGQDQCSNITYASAYLFFEKLRIYDGKPKTVERLRNEQLYPNGFSLIKSHSKNDSTYGGISGFAATIVGPKTPLKENCGVNFVVCGSPEFC